MTNIARAAESVVAFYNKRGTAIKEGKTASTIASAAATDALSFVALLGHS